MGFICELRVILRFFIHVKAYTIFDIIRSIVNAKAVTEQSERPSITEAPKGLHTSRKRFWPFSSIWKIHQNMDGYNSSKIQS